ncbi:MAG: HipA family kinase [Clostridium sp.]|nr:HipA family kinase [Clostridium sp.]MDU7085210.1 HipA family kinase [Clostridium sp.]
MYIAKNVKSVLGKVGTGITEPIIGIIDGKQAIIKTINNDEGNKVLINEIVCSSMAKMLNLPIADYGVCVIDDSTLFENNFIIDKERYGPGYFTYRLDNVTSIVNSPKLINKYIENKECFLKIILFDCLVYNKDRHKGNILMSTGKKDSSNMVYIIDHSHVFNIGSLWDKYQLKRMMQENDYESIEVFEYNKSIYELLLKSIDFSIEYNVLLKEAETVKNIFTKEFFNHVIKDIPNEWNTDPEDTEMLIEYLLYRVNHVEEIVKLIFKFIKTQITN